MPETTTPTYGYFFNRAYLDKAKQYEKLRDVVGGNEKVKDKGVHYLPQPSGATDEAYVAYLNRALFYPVCERTIRGLLGIIFKVPPVMELPERLKRMKESATPEGDSLLEAFTIATREVLHMGRHGLMLDLPKQADVNATPYISQYLAENITNWKREFLQDGRRLTRVVVRETTDPDGSDAEQFLELYLDIPRNDAGEIVGEPVYKLKRWRLKVDYRGSTVSIKGEPEEFTPSIAGKTLNYIPFYFIGPYSLKPDVEKSPLLDLADANLAHYKNSANYEQSLFMVAQPTPYVIGDLLDSELPKKIGSSAFWVLPAKTQDIGMLEFSGAGIGALLDGMTKKEEYMAALGAKLVHRQMQPETAEAVRIKSRDEISIIESTVMSVDRAFDTCLKDASEWCGCPRASVKVDVNTDFVEGKLSAGEVAELFATMQLGGISHDVYHRNLQRGEIMPADRTVDEEKQAIAKDQADRQAAGQTPAVPGQEAAGGQPGEDVDPAELEGEDDPAVASPSKGEKVVATGNPYKVVKRAGKFCVVKADGGKLVKGGCHGADKAAAMAHFKALEASVSKE